MITKTLQKEFPGICALLGALKRAWKAYRVFNKAIQAVSVVVVAEPSGEWIQKVSGHSQLSYEEAHEVYKFITEETGLYPYMEKGITEFIMDRGNCGYSFDVIIRYLAYIDSELDKWMRDKLRMPP